MIREWNRVAARRATALFLLIVTSTFSFEAVAGMLRDGQVHHEDLATAALHADQADGDHGHEDTSTPSSHRHGKNHEHGTSTDHCTHQHGIALVPSFSFVIVGIEMSFEPSDQVVPHPTISDKPVHPPRA